MRALTRRGTVLGLLVLAGLLGLVASAQPWFSAVGESTVAFSGAEASGGLTQALSAVVLAGVLLTLVLGVRGRRVVAVLLALAGVGMSVVGLLRTPPTAAAVRARFRQVSLADSYVLDGTAWPWPYAIAGLLVIGGAVLLWLGCPGWARRGRRYERSVRTHEADEPDEGGAWRAQDAGLDPTREPSDEGHGSELKSDPDVRSGGTTDTMGASRQASPRRQIGDQ